MAPSAEIYSIRWLLVSLAFLLFAARKYRRYDRLKAFKGPFSTGFSEIWHTRAFLSLKSHLRYGDVCHKYGPIARVGPNDLITCLPELLFRMSSVRSPYTRSIWFHRSVRFQPGKDHVFSEVDEKKHTKRRQQMAAGYSGKENLALESTIDASLKQLLHLIRSKYISSDAVSRRMDLARKIQYFTLDVISEIGLGQSFGDVTADADLNGYAQSAEEGLMAMTVFTALGMRWLLDIPVIAWLLGPSEKDKTGFGKMMATSRSLVDSRLVSSMDTRTDMLASFMRHGLTRDELFSESLLQILAGSDTTATALRAIMLYLFSHPRIYIRLQAEIDAVMKTGRIQPSPNIITDSEARNLPYLQACIKEGLRIHPPVADIIPKVVPPGGDTVIVEGKPVFLPSGTNVGYSAWGLHHSKAIFGDDADEFRPERWLLDEDEKNSEKLAMMNRTSELIFGYGKYQCLGKPVAWMEIGKATFELLRHFDWELANPENPWKETNLMGIFMQSDMWVHVSERRMSL